MNYLVSDLVIRLKNACMAKRKQVEFAYSKMGKEIAKVLVKENYLEDLKEETTNGKKILVGKIRYEKRVPVFSDCEVVSKPSLRIYIGAKNLTKIQGGLGISVVSTNQGIMAGYQARKKGLGGEILFKIW
ncbi:MAG: 30S ribosomal protein S8 [Candidatus Levyibacteriota bacterium]